ncbi:MAG: hypothetical protein US99_C0071G0001, partial [Candidatus Daviesbacteria bacterium GW2011_GWF2_38_6]
GSDYLKVCIKYLEDKNRINYAIGNTNGLTREILRVYKKDGQEPVEIDEDACVKVSPKLKIIKSPLAVYHIREHLLRHDCEKLAQTILQLDKR